MSDLQFKPVSKDGNSNQMPVVSGAAILFFFGAKLISHLPGMHLTGATRGLSFSEKGWGGRREGTSKFRCLVKYITAEKIFHYHYNFVHCPKFYEFQAQGSS